VGVISAMAYRSSDIRHPLLPLEEIPISFNFTGHITEVSDPHDLLNGAITPGDGFSVRFAYDMNAPYKYPNPNLSAPYGVSVSINNMIFASKGTNAVIKNNYYDYRTDEVSDQFWISSVDGSTVFPIPMHDGSIYWGLTDYSGTTLSNNNVLPADIDLTLWDENVFHIYGGTPDPEGLFYYISGVVDNCGGGSGGGGGGGEGGCFIATAGRGT